MSKKREISILNVLFCLMVIFIHVSSYPITSLSPYSLAVKLLYPFQRFFGVAVYGFIFLSGLKLFLNKKKINLKKYYISRIKRVFIPYLIITTLYYFYEVHRGYFSYSTKELLLFYLNGNVECHLYFVVIIMQFYILFPLWKVLTEKSPLFVLLVSALLNIVFVYYMADMLKFIGINDFIYNDRVFTSYLFYWILGCFCGKYYDKFKEIIKKYILFFSFAFIVLLYLDVSMAYSIFTGNKISRFMDFIHLMYCLSSVLFLYAAAFKFSDLKIMNKLLSWIDGASYEIYLIHIFFVHIINDLISEFAGIGVLKAYIIRFFSVYILSITVCVCYKLIVNKFLKKV